MSDALRRVGAADRALVVAGVAPGGVRELGLDWTYERFDVGEAELADFVAGCGPEWRGLSLTMPLKVAALALGEPDPVATAVRAANTLIFESDGRRVYNTDVEGLVAALRRAGLERADRVTLVGSGATARSTLASLAQLGTRQVALVARSAERARPTIASRRARGWRSRVHGWDGPVPTGDLLVATVVGRGDRVEIARRSSPRARRWCSTRSTIRGRPRSRSPLRTRAGRWSTASTCWSARPSSSSG